jgi:hypothetical protein
MEKTTVYLPVRLKRALERTARQRNVSAAQLLRESIARMTEEAAEAPPPKLPLFHSSGRSIATRIDRELVKGFGRR